MIYIKNVGERKVINKMVDNGGVRGPDGKYINRQCVGPIQGEMRNSGSESDLHTFPPMASALTVDQALREKEKLGSSPDKVS